MNPKYRSYTKQQVSRNETDVKIQREFARQGKLLKAEARNGPFVGCSEMVDRARRNTARALNLPLSTVVEWYEFVSR